MNIGSKYKIESDALNITLYGKHTKRGELRWEVIGYFGTVQNALRHLVDLGVRESHLTDLKAICEKQEELYALIGNLSLKDGGGKPAGKASSTHKQSVTEGIEVKSSS